MGYALCTAEKPSVAKKIAEVIGAVNKNQGYYEGNGYLVTWAVGHLVGLAEPTAYGYMSQNNMYESDESRDKAYAELPLIPAEFKLVVLPNTKEQFKVMKTLMHRDDVDYIIDCGDMGAEGHILQWFIRVMAGNEKPVKRFCATTSLTPEAILDGMKHLRNADEFMPVIRGEYCKKKADWIMGMSLSRVESIKYHAGINVGRVQSPTLYFIYKRWIDVKSFKITNYYTMDTELTENFHVFWQKDTQNAFPPSLKDSEGRVLDMNVVKNKANEIQAAGTGIITVLTKEKKLTNRPQLFDATELQREANRRYGYSAAVTLATSQALYEKDIMSYPRTDSRYITSDVAPSLENLVKQVGTIPKYKAACDKLLSAGLTVDKRIVDDSKVTDHHALIPIKIANLDFNTLIPADDERKQGVTPDTMRNVLDLCLCRLIVSLSSPYVYEQTNVAVTFNNGLSFTSSGRRLIQSGWKDVDKGLRGGITEDEDSGNAEQVFPDIQKGQTVNIRSVSVVPKKTTPPKLLTEDTLLTLMENAGATIENGSILKGKGIGTAATRAGIIKKLFDIGVVQTDTENKGKTKYIIPTSKGVAVIQVLPPELYSPKITADWETKIAEIADKKATEESFLDEFKTFIQDKVNEVKSSDMKVNFKKEMQTYGKCPWCAKNPALSDEEKDAADIYCYEKKDEKGKSISKWYHCSQKCGFGVDTSDKTIVMRTGRRLTDAEVKKLIAKGRITLDCKKKNGDGTYRGDFTLVRNETANNVYCDIHFDFVKKFAKN